MPAKLHLPSLALKPARTKKGLYILAVVIVVGLAAWANSAWAAAAATTNSAISPALKLAAGTLKLEGTDQAIDAASAAKLLPLWQLIAQLENSGTAAPEELTAVISDIQLNMTASQVKAIETRSFSQTELGNAGGNTGAAKASGTQVAAAVNDPMLTGGITGSGAPMDGGGPMPPESSQGASSSKSSTTAPTSSAIPAVIQQVIELLQSKVQS